MVVVWRSQQSGTEVHCFTGSPGGNPHLRTKPSLPRESVIGSGGRRKLARPQCGNRTANENSRMNETGASLCIPIDLLPCRGAPPQLAVPCHCPNEDAIATAESRQNCRHAVPRCPLQTEHGRVWRSTSNQTILSRREFPRRRPSFREDGVEQERQMCPARRLAGHEGVRSSSCSTFRASAAGRVHCKQDLLYPVTLIPKITSLT
jgi:hypothetical protein